MNCNLSKIRCKKKVFIQLLKEGLELPKYKDLKDPDNETLMNVCIDAYYPTRTGCNRLKRLILEYWVEHLNINLKELYQLK